MCCYWCYIINEDLGDDMDIIQPEHLGSCLKSVTSSHETILKVDLSDNDEVKDLVQLIEKQLKETRNHNYYS